MVARGEKSGPKAGQSCQSRNDVAEGKWITARRGE
jgi:hypothetical protein